MKLNISSETEGVRIRFKLSRTFKAFLVSYILILLLPNISGYISYRISIQEAKASSIKIGKSVLDQSKQNVDQRLEEVISFTQQLSSDADLEQLINRSDVQNNVMVMYQLAQTLTHYANTNDFLSNIFVYLKSSNAIIAPGSVFVRPNHYYALNHPAGSNYDQWLQDLMEGRDKSNFSQAKSYMVHGLEKKYVVYTQTLPIESLNSVSGTVVILIDEEKILNLLNGITSKFGGWGYIADSKGQIIASTGITDEEAAKMNPLSTDYDEQAVNDDTIILSSSSPQLINWHYVAGMPKSVIMKSAYRIQNVTWLLTALTIVSGLLASLFLAYRNSRPLQKIAESFRDFLKQDEFSRGSEYDFIQGNISQILSNNRFLRSEIIRQEPILKDVFVKRLINGEFASTTGIYTAASQANIDRLDEQGFIVLLQIRGYGDMESKEILNELFAARMIMKRAILEVMPETLLTELDFDKLVISIPIAPDTGNKEIELHRVLDPLLDLNSKKYKLLFAVAISSPYYLLGEIKRAYEEARQTLEYSNFLDSDGIFWYQDLPQDSVMYYYPLELELRVHNAIRIGDYVETEAILNGIFYENFEARELSVDNHSLLIADLKTSIIKGFDVRGIVDSSELKAIKTQIAHLQASYGTEPLKKMMLQSVQAFCSLIGEQKNETENRLVGAIIDYLNNEFTDPGLSMNLLADEIGRPEKYLAQIFKEHTGEYIYIHLEKIRMQRAQQLLLETDEKIEIISEKCGYASPQSFRRAFKRYFGITPNEYRTTVK